MNIFLKFWKWHKALIKLNKNRGDLHKNKIRKEINIMKTNKKIKSEYPRIEELGLTIITKCPNSIPGVSFKEIREKLGAKKYKIFSEMYGCQTVGMNGPYVHDIESVLERMMSGKLTGTQAWMD